MIHPKIKFIIDAKQDIKNYILFKKYSDPKFLKMFLPPELDYILEKSLSDKKKEEVVGGYVKNKFNSSKKTIEKNIKETTRRWNLIQKDFFKLIDKIFKKRPWPKGKYTAFVSVFWMFPRNIDEKIFYFSGLQKNINFNLATIAHEMLHFMFFDYIKDRYGINEGDELKNKNPKYVWNISEVFNLVIETWKPYQHIFKTKGMPYDSAHAKMLPKMRKLWREKEDMGCLLDFYFKI